MRDYSISIRPAKASGLWALYIDGDFEGYFRTPMAARAEAARLCGYPAGMED